MDQEERRLEQVVVLLDSYLLYLEARAGSQHP